MAYGATPTCAAALDRTGPNEEAGADAEGIAESWTVSLGVPWSMISPRSSDKFILSVPSPDEIDEMSRAAAASSAAGCAMAR